MPIEEEGNLLIHIHSASRWNWRALRPHVPLTLALVGVPLSIVVFGWWRMDRQRREVQSKVYRIGVDSNPPRYDWIQDRGPQGFAVDVLNHAAKRSGIRLEWVHCPNGSRRAFLDNQVDIWPIGYYRPGEYPQWHQTRPWSDDQHVLVWDRRRYPAEPANWTGKRIAFINRVASINLADRWFPKSEKRLVDTRRDALAVTCQGDADAALVDLRMMEAAMLKRPKACEGVPLEMKAQPGMAEGMSIFSLQSAAPAADMLRDEIDAMSRDGSLSDISDRWFAFSGSDTRAMARLAERSSQVRLLAVICISMAFAIGLLVHLVGKLRAARLSAERARQLQAEFLANVSHEIRTPMNGVVGTTELMLDMPLDPVQRGYVETIYESARTQLELLNQILDQSKMDSGLLLLETSVFCPYALASQVERTFRNAAQRKGLTLRLVHDDEPRLPLQGDALRIRQVVSNLVNNAIKFTEKGGVDIRVARIVSGPLVDLRFSVADTGIGIEPAQQAAIFERFRQADPSTTRRYGGTGLGLSISRQLASMMGGSLTVQSEPGRGSTFHFRLTLPAAPTAPGGLASEPDSGAGAILEHMQILVVEDNAVNQKVAAEILRRMGASVELAGNGRQAVERCRGNHFDVILMDCHMPEMDGFAATAEIRKLDTALRDVPIVALTAGVSGEERVKALNAGMSAFLSKPVSRDEIAATITTLVRRKSEG